MNIKDVFNNSTVSFIGYNYNNFKQISIKKYFTVNEDFFLFFVRRELNLNISLDNESHSNEMGLKQPCICFKTLKNKNYISVYYKETVIGNNIYEDYCLNAFEKQENQIYFKKYNYSKNKNFISKILKKYSIQNNNFYGIEICNGNSYRNSGSSDKIAIIDEKSNYQKLKIFNSSFINLEIPNNQLIAYGKDLHSTVSSYYFTNAVTWKLPEKLIYN